MERIEHTHRGQERHSPLPPAEGIEEGRQMNDSLSTEQMNAIIAVAELAEKNEQVATQIAIAILANAEQTLAALKLGVARAKTARGESIEGWY